MKDEADAKIAYLVALNGVQGPLGAVTKDSTNPHFGSKFASLTSVNDTIMGPLTEAGFVVTAGGVDIGGKPYLRTTLSHIKGHSESYDYPIVFDGNPQHTLASITYARRGALCALLNLSLEDDDGETSTTGVATKTTAKTPLAHAGGQSDAGVVSFVPTIVKSTPGGTPEKPWVKVSVKLPDDSWASTFNETHGAIIGNAEKNGTKVKIALVKRGVYLNIGSVMSDAEPEMSEVPF